MGFTQSCIIRTNSDELRGKLLEMGCVYGGHDSSSRPYLYCHRGTFYETSAIRISRNEKIVECDMNEKLFLAVAGMRDDTERKQYFVDEEGWSNVNLCMYSPAGNLTLSNVDNFTKLNNESSFPRKYHRATLEEIIEYFDDKEAYFKKCREERYPEKPVVYTMKSATSDEYVCNFNGEKRIIKIK